MAVPGTATFERLFREIASLDVDKSDLKRYQDFVRDKVADLLVIGEAHAKADQRDVVELRDLPITKGLQETIHDFREVSLAADTVRLLRDIVTVPQMDLSIADETDAALPELAGALTLALGRTFRILDPTLENPATDAWERAFRVFDLLL